MARSNATLLLSLAIFVQILFRWEKLTFENNSNINFSPQIYLKKKKALDPETVRPGATLLLSANQPTNQPPRSTFKGFDTHSSGGNKSLNFELNTTSQMSFYAQVWKMK